MARKAQAVNISILVLLYVLVGGIFPIVNYYENAVESGDPDAKNTAETVLTAFFVIWSIILAFLIIYRIWLQFNYIKLANRHPRHNMTLITNTGMVLEEGVGIKEYKEIKTAKMKVENILTDRKLIAMFSDFYAWLEKIHGKENIVERYDKKNTVAYEIPSLKPSGLNLRLYDIRYLSIKSLKSFFDKAEMQFLAENGVDNIEQFNNLTQAEIHDLQMKFNQQTSQMLQDLDFKNIQLISRNCLDMFNKKEIDFFMTNGIKNIENLVDADHDDISKKFNDMFALKDIKEKIVNRLKKALNMNYKEGDIDLKQVTMDVLNTLVERERRFEYKISNDDRFKYIYLKLYVLKSIHYNLHAYLVQLDRNIEIEVGKNYIPVDDPLEKMVKNEDDFDEETTIEVNQILMILPCTIDKAFHYAEGWISDFNGIAITCEQLTDSEFVYRGLLSPEIAVLLCNNCSYMRDEIKFQMSIDPITLQYLERDALIEVVNDLKSSVESIHKHANILKKRIEKKDDQFEYLFASAIDDMDSLDVASKIIMEKKPFNAFHIVVMISMLLLGLLIGLIAGGVVNFLNPTVPGM